MKDRRRRRRVLAAVPLAVAGLTAVPGLTRARSAAPAGGTSPRPVALASAGPALVPVVDPSAALERALLELAPDLRADSLRPAIAAWERLRMQELALRPILTVIDYGLPSSKPRLWVFDMEERRLLFHELVAHGRNSGGDLATSFSNVEGSYMTSLGTFLTEGVYVGNNGYSLRLRGLEPGINDQALTRAIVVHGAPYVDAGVAHQLGRLGRSLGCPALRPAVARPLIDAIKGGSVLFAWHPSASAHTGTDVASGLAPSTLAFSAR